MYNIVSIADRKIERSSWENVESTRNQKLKIRNESSVKLIEIWETLKIWILGKKSNLADRESVKNK